MNFAGHLRIGEWKLSPGCELSDEAEAWRFVSISSGPGYILESGRRRSVNAGELAVLGPGVRVVIRASLLGEMVLHGFGFAPDLLWGFLTLSERNFLEAIAHERAMQVQVLPATHPVVQGLEREVADAENQASLASRARLLALAGKFLGDLFRQHQQPDVRAASVRCRFDEIIDTLSDAEMARRPPEQLASLCGCSTRHFSQLFRARFGRSLRVHLGEMRLTRASQLLATTGAKITDVAFDSGYRSLTQFNSGFRKRFEMTPSEWRQKAREDRRSAPQTRSELTATFRTYPPQP